MQKALLLMVAAVILAGCASAQRVATNEQILMDVADEVDAHETHLANHEQRLTFIESLHVEEGTKVPEYDIYFGFNQYEMRSGERSKIKKLLEFLEDYPMFGIKLTGYADTVGTDKYNRHLARQRTLAVRYALQQRGIPPGVFVKTAVGEAEGPDEQRNPENRKVHIKVHVHSRKSDPSGIDYLAVDSDDYGDDEL